MQLYIKFFCKEHESLFISCKNTQTVVGEILTVIQEDPSRLGSYTLRNYPICNIEYYRFEE